MRCTIADKALENHSSSWGIQSHSRLIQPGNSQQLDRRVDLEKRMAAALNLEQPPPTPRALAMWEIVSVVTSCLIAEWVVLSFVGRSKLIIAIPIVLAVGLMLFSHRQRDETLKDVGFRSDNFFAACRLLLLPTALAVIIALMASWLINHTLLTGNFTTRFLWLPLWALFQQYALNGFINRRAQIALGKGPKSIVLVGDCFQFASPPKSASRASDAVWRIDLGGRISAAAKSFRSRAVACGRFSNNGINHLSELAQQFARRLQVFWLIRPLWHPA